MQDFYVVIKKSEDKRFVDYAVQTAKKGGAKEIRVVENDEFKPNSDDFTIFVSSVIDIAMMRLVLNDAILQKHMENGVFIWGDGTFVDSGVKIAAGTEILPGCIIQGDTIIGANCKIGPYAVINDAKIGDDSTVGPFVQIRPESVLGKEVRIGNFVEIKATSIGDGSKASHLSYLGDAKIGDGVNIGCGAVTVNYDGRKKYKTEIKDEAFIGCNVNLIAPITIGKKAFVAAGSTINNNVPEKTLAISRSKEEAHKKDWIHPADRS